MPFFVDPEGQAGRLSVEQAVNTIWINREDQTERRIDDRHHHLKFDARAGSDTGVRTRQEFYLLCRELSVTIENLPCELALSEHPSVSDIEERSHREDASDNRNAIFQ